MYLTLFLKVIFQMPADKLIINLQDILIFKYVFKNFFSFE